MKYAIAQAPFDGLKAIKTTYSTEPHNFPSLKYLDLDHILLQSMNTIRVLPYDLYCPSVQSQLAD